MILVVDASVVVKWLLREHAAESDGDLATALMNSVANGASPIVQPVHWLAEVAAVLNRLSTATAERDVRQLHSMELPIADSSEIWVRACRLGAAYRQHVFDTLYHAVALETAGARLVTADDRYLRATRKAGRVLGLRQWWQEQPEVAD